MLVYPLTPDAADITDEARVDAVYAVPAPVLEVPRTFCVVFLRDARGPLWKVDVVADDALSAARSVVYREDISAELVTGVIDLATIR